MSPSFAIPPTIIPQATPANWNGIYKSKSSASANVSAASKENGAADTYALNGTHQGPVVESLACTMLGAPPEPLLSPASPDWDLHQPATAIDAKDVGTADAWVPRDPRIQRLTGRHPLNCEPPMKELMEGGFITPAAIHYVRSHGAVPRIRWEEHRLRVGGLVQQPLSLSMDQLLDLPAATFPVTMVCAGNRRKEQNMRKKTIGFNWGPCGVSTGFWTGVKLRDLLLLAGVKAPPGNRGYVCFSGPDGELPKGDGTYGTSIPLSKAMDPTSDVLVAYKHNFRWLTPDHGFPVRTILPGHIGGRTIKWLTSITVTAEESQNHYHFFDNRVLPSHVDQELGNKEGWWYRPEYMINDLNINSAVARPGHDEVVYMDEQGGAPYTVTGYAYSGGGHMIIRVEISLDGGATWRLANIRRFEEPNEYGKYWCWVFWDIEVPGLDFFQSRELLLRAWDNNQNTQPAALTWNVMGMMNNCHFRVLIHTHVDAVSGRLGVRFQHPAPLEVGALGNRGWREDEHLRAQALEEAGLPAHGPMPNVHELAAVKAAKAAKEASAAKPAAATNNGRTYTMEEVAAHASAESAWFVHEGRVYDATPFLKEHPGGADSIIIAAGGDATEDFNAIHSKNARAMLEPYYIGDLAAGGGGAPAAAANGGGGGAHVNEKGELVALHPKHKVALKLMERIEISHNTRIFRFALPSPQHKLGLPTGRHLFVYATIGGETVIRAYTPISTDQDLGRLDLLVKVYNSNQHPSFPQGGKLSQHLDRLKIGDEIQVKGPIGHFIYEGRGHYLLHGHQRGFAKRLSMLAAGTGITPILQVLEAVLRDKDDPTVMSLVYSNQTEDDILLRERLDGYAAEQPHRFKMIHVLSRAGPSWTGARGRVTAATMVEHLFDGHDPETLSLMCGPPGLLEGVAVPAFEAMGFDKERQVQF